MPPSIVSSDTELFVDSIDLTADLYLRTKEKLNQAGWTLHGKGLFSQVFAHINYDFVIKFFCDTAYLEFLSNFRDRKYLPKLVSEVKRRSVDTEYTHVVLLKKLERIPDDKFADLIDDIQWFGWANEDELSEDLKKVYALCEKDFIEVFEDIRCFTQKNNYRLDIKLDNFMFDPKGQYIVFNDMIFSSDERDKRKETTQQTV